MCTAGCPAGGAAAGLPDGDGVAAGALDGAAAGVPDPAVARADRAASGRPPEPFAAWVGWALLSAAESPAGPGFGAPIIW